MATNPYIDGEVSLTTLSNDVLAAIFATLHETIHREPAPDGAAPSAGVSAKELALYDATLDEFAARIANNRLPKILHEERSAK